MLNSMRGGRNTVSGWKIVDHGLWSNCYDKQYACCSSSMLVGEGVLLSGGMQIVTMDLGLPAMSSKVPAYAAVCW